MPINYQKAKDIAEASTEGAFEAVIFGIIPVIEFGVLVALALFLVQLPLKVVNRFG